MRIGIITIHNSPNYGACLQAFALWKYLVNSGYECEIIDLHRPHQSDYIPSKKFVECRKPKVSIRTKIKKVLLGALKKEKSKRYLTEEAQTRFNLFNSQIKFSRPYYGIDELYNNPPEYDVYITGSDQLWNPTQPFCLEPYFLTFVPEGKKRISYASSIGISELTTTEKQEFGQWLSKYAAISVREKQAQHLLQSFVGTSIARVADPTFLLTRTYWKSIAVCPKIEEKFILLFTLSYNDYLLRYTIELGKQRGIKVVYLTAIQTSKSDDYIAVDNAGPQEWIGYIAKAEMVITDSFHGTVFSIITNTKNFYTYIAPSNVRGSRIIDLLDIFNLSSHLLNPCSMQDFCDMASNSISYELVNKKMEQEARMSQMFLEKAF